MLKVNNNDTERMRNICSKLTIKTVECVKFSMPAIEKIEQIENLFKVNNKDTRIMRIIPPKVETISDI